MMAQRERILAFLLLAVASVTAPAAQNPVLSDPPPYAVFDSREVRELFREAEEHLTQSRWSQGVALLQRIVDKFPDDVWSPEVRPGSYLGAAYQAESRIASLPPEGKKAYQDSFGPQARVAIDEALRQRSPLLVQEVVQRYGATQEGQVARLWLSDYRTERGEWAEAKRLLAAWNRNASEPEKLDRKEDWALRWGLLFHKTGDREGLQKLADGAATLDSSVQEMIRQWLAETSSALPAPEAHGFQAADSSNLPSEPKGIREIGWRFTEGDGAFPRPFSSDRGVPDPVYNLHPSLSGDRVVFSDSVGVFCLDLFSGKELWRYAGASGWERVRDRERRLEFFGSGINPHVSVAGAVQQDVAIFPLQVPLKLHENVDFQGIAIKTILPTRRLFAFDLTTGRPLWNHWRPELARLGAGEFVDQTSVSSPPLVAGDRVFAAISRMEGKIDYYLACFELRSGRLLWKTPIVTGQLELNMFGRPIREFAGSPLLLRDGNLYFSTNLGVAACVEANQGRIRWISRYDQIPIPPAVSFHRAPRNFFWANQPPAMDEGTLFLTPIDSEYLYAFEAESGEFVTRLHFNRVERGSRHLAGLRHLLGVADGRLLLSGNFVYAFAVRPGMGAPLYSPLWQKPLLRNDFTKSSFLPRGTVTDRSVVVPDLEGIHFLSLEDGSAVSDPVSWQNRERDRGNLLISGGISLSLAEASLEVRFDWESLLADARRRTASGEPEDLERLGRLLRRRGDAFVQQKGTAAESAIPAYTEASQILEELVAMGRPGAAAELANLAMSLGEMEERRGRFTQALTYYERARQRAVRPEMRLEAALKRSELLRQHGDAQAFESSLQDLQTHFANERRQIEGEGEIPIGLHVLLLRYRSHAARNEWENSLASLQEILLRYGGETLDREPVADFARDAIAAVLRAAGRGVFAPYEAQAKEKLDAAMESKDREAVLEVLRLYPNALAVSRAYLALADLSIASGDAATVATVCRRFLAGETDPQARASMMRRMAYAFERIGNRPLSRAILAKLARRHPELISDLAEDRGAPYHALLPPATPRPATVGPKPPLQPSAEFPLARTSLSVMPVLGESPASFGLYLLVADNELQVYRPGQPQGLSKPLWRLSLQPDPEEFGQPIATVTGKRIAIASGRRIQGYEVETGEALWSRILPSPILDGFSRGGVFVYLLRERRGSYRCEAIDAYGGISLWSMALPGEHLPTPILGDAEIAFLPSGLQENRVLAHDLFTGSVEVRLQVPRVPEVVAGAISAGQLLLAYPPAMSRGAPREERVPLLRGFPLQEEAASWKTELPSKFSIHSFLFAMDKPYLVLSGRDPRDEEGGAIYAIEPAQARAVPALSLPSGSFLPGLIPNITNSIEEKELLVLYPETKGFLRANLVDIETGKTLWKRSLPHPVSQLSEPDLSLPPLFTENVLFLPLKIQRPNSAGSRVEVMSIDRKTSETAGTSFSLGEIPPGADVDLSAFPGVLIVQKGLGLKTFQGEP